MYSILLTKTTTYQIVVSVLLASSCNYALALCWGEGHLAGPRIVSMHYSSHSLRAWSTSTSHQIFGRDQPVHHIKSSGVINQYITSNQAWPQRPKRQTLGSVNMRRKNCYLQAGERSFSPHIDRTWGLPFRPSLIRCDVLVDHAIPELCNFLCNFLWSFGWFCNNSAKFHFLVHHSRQ